MSAALSPDPAATLRLTEDVGHYRDRAERAEAQVARVRALCDAWEADYDRYGPTKLSFVFDRIRTALDIPLDVDERDQRSGEHAGPPTDSDDPAREGILSDELVSPTPGDAECSAGRRDVNGGGPSPDLIQRRCLSGHV